MKEEATKTKTTAAAQQRSVFATLAAIDCGEHIEKKKNGQTELSYLSWAWAWHYIKANYPDAFYTIYERPDGIPYWTDGRTCWVKTGVTINGQEHIEYLPIMDYRNQSIPVDRVTSMDMNKAIQRSLTKAAARHGLGLYIYAGEDLPLSEEEAKEQEAAQQQPSPKKAPAKKATKKAEQEAPKKHVSDLSPDHYAVWVKAAVENRLTKNGVPARDAFIATFNPTAEELADFDDAVFALRMDAGIPANAPATSSTPVNA